MRIKRLSKSGIIFLLLFLMSNQRFNYYDPEFNPADAAGCSLLIMISDNTFSFTIIQKRANKVLVWGENYRLEELNTSGDLSDILLAPFAETKIGVQSQSFTIVHRDLFRANQLAGFAKCLDAQTNETILVNLLDDDNYVIFKISGELTTAVSEHFDLKWVFFAGKPWIAAINMAKPYIQPLYAHITGSVVQLYHTNNDKLDFYNRFQFSNPDELMYYVVLTANELNINLDATSVILSGDITVSDKRIQRVSDLLPKVYFNQNQVVSLPSGFISHQILMLAGLSLCESLAVN